MAPKRAPPLPPVESSVKTGSGSDESAEESAEEGDEDEHHQEEEEGDGDDEEGEKEGTEDKEEEEDENGGKQSLLNEAKKPASPWPEEDEVHFHNAIIAHRRKHGKPPKDDEFEAILAGSLEYSPSQLENKIKNLRNFYRRNVCKVKPPSIGHNARIFSLQGSLGRG
jgi:flagellar biosynthesis GTPase FlhF